MRVSDHRRRRLAPEKSRLRLGYIPLADCAPLVVTKELGHYADEGLDVTLCPEHSWANIRDKVQLGALDAAQMLAPIPVAATLGIDGRPTPTLAAMTLNLNGNAITVSSEVFARMEAEDEAVTRERPMTARPLRGVIEARRRAGQPRLRLASVYPFSTHNYQLRYWLAAAGIDPDRDLRLRVVPPPLMATHLETGWIDGYCVGEPWNSVAVAHGLGRTLITSYELWNNGQEKVLGVRQDWAENYPATHRALLRALLRACRWLDRSAGRNKAARMLADGGYVEAPASTLVSGLTGRFDYGGHRRSVRSDDFVVFHRYAANFPWRSHALWYAIQMARWGQLPDKAPIESAVRQSVRPDLFRLAAADLGLACPAQDFKREGEHTDAWMLETDDAVIPMGPDRFFDGMGFDPDELWIYLAHLPFSGAHADTG